MSFKYPGLANWLWEYTKTAVQGLSSNLAEDAVAIDLCNGDSHGPSESEWLLCIYALDIMKFLVHKNRLIYCQLQGMW